MAMYVAYINGDDGEKKDMERRYGKKQLEMLVDDIQTASWMGQHSKQCPHCKAHIEVSSFINDEPIRFINLLGFLVEITRFIKLFRNRMDATKWPVFAATHISVGSAKLCLIKNSPICISTALPPDVVCSKVNLWRQTKANGSILFLMIAKKKNLYSTR